jgi:CBS domain-containing protein
VAAHDDQDPPGASEALVRDAMSRGFPTLEAATSIAGAASLLCTKGWQPVPVLDGDGRLAGVVSEHDVVRAVARGLDTQRTAVSEIATTGLPSVSPDASLAEAGAALGGSAYGLGLVLEDERVVGVLTASDLEGHALIEAALGAGAADVITEISPNDIMYAGSWGAYAYAGVTALGCIREILEKLGRAAPGRILDLPCGHGRELRFLKVAYPDARFAVSDIDRDGVDFCARTFDADPIYSHEDPADVVFGEPYDLAWCGSLFTHLSADRWPGFLELFARALVPGGLLLFTANGLLPADVLQGLGLSGAEAERLLGDFKRDDFGYIDVAGGAWGLSLARPVWVKEQIERSRLELVSYERWAWKPPFPAQDVLVCTLPGG